MAKDKITGFEGTIIAKTYYLFGCYQYGLAPKVNKDGKREDCEWFDMGRIEILGEGFKEEEVRGEKPGCEMREHPIV